MASLRHSITNALRSSRQACSKSAQWQQSLDQQFGALRISGSRSLSTFTNESNPNVDGQFVAAPALSSDYFRLHPHARAVPISPSYFTRTPRFYDNYLSLERLMEEYEDLPVIPAAAVERVAWKTLDDIRQELGEQVKASEFARCLTLIKRLNSIHPDLKPQEIKDVLDSFKRNVQPYTNVAKPIPIDQFGRACGVGRRKASSARAYVVEGTGEVLVNGKTLADYFGRVHDRESAVWALRATKRIDKYNVWVKVEGGGTTGQAEAITLAIAKALLAHEPALKPALRRGKLRTTTPHHTSSWLSVMIMPRHTGCYFRGMAVGRDMIPLLTSFPLFFSCYSRMCHTRPEKGRKKEARPSQGQKDAYLGQEIVALSPATTTTFLCVVSLGGCVMCWRHYGDHSCCLTLFGFCMNDRSNEAMLFSLASAAASKLIFLSGKHIFPHAAYSICGICV